MLVMVASLYKECKKDVSYLANKLQAICYVSANRKQDLSMADMFFFNGEKIREPN